MRTICVIDEGGHSVKIVTMTQSWKTIKITGYSKTLMPSDVTDRERVLDDLYGQLVSEPDIGGMDIYSLLPCRQVFFRNLQFEFSQHRKIEKVLPLQLEMTLPLKHHHFVVDFLSTGYGADGNHEVFCAASRKTDVEARINRFTKTGMELQGLHISPVDLVNLLNQSKETYPDHVLIIDLGGDTATLSFVHNRALRYVRVLLLDSSKGLSSSANTRDHTGEQSGSAARDDNKKWYEECIRGIEKTITYFCDKLDGKRPETVYLCGGGAMIPGITGILEQNLDIPCTRLNGELRNLLQDGPQEDEMSAYLPAISVGYSVLKNPKRQNMEFLRGEYQVSRGVAAYKKQLILCAVLVLVFLGLYSYSIRSSVNSKEKQAAEMDRIIQRIFKRNMPEAGRIVNPVMQMQAYLQEQQSLYPSAGENNLENRGSAFDVLRLIHAKIPADITLTITELQVDPNRIFMTGETLSFDSIAQIKTSLEAVPFLTEITVTTEKLQGQSGKIKFTMKCSIVKVENKDNQ